MAGVIFVFIVLDMVIKSASRSPSYKLPAPARRQVHRSDNLVRVSSRVLLRNSYRALANFSIKLSSFSYLSGSEGARGFGFQLTTALGAFLAFPEYPLRSGCSRLGPGVLCGTSRGRVPGALEGARGPFGVVEGITGSPPSALGECVLLC